MSEMIVSWKYVFITDIGLKKILLFQCIDSIKLELSYQVFLHLMKSNDPKKELEKKFRVVRVKDGYVDLSKFEIKTHKTKTIFKIIRDGNEQPNKRERPVYSGPEQAIFYECEQKITLKNQRFIDDF